MLCSTLLSLALPLFAPVEAPSLFKITPDRATITIADSGRTLVVVSPTGIGKARIELVGKEWPRNLAMRIGIKGLEGFICRNERLEIRGALGLAEVEIRRRENAGAKWSPAKVFGEPKLVTRRKGGTIEVEIPSELLSPEAKTLEVEWVDFYRG